MDLLNHPSIGKLFGIFEFREGALEEPLAKEEMKRQLGLGVPVCCLPLVGDNVIYFPPRFLGKIFCGSISINDRRCQIKYSVL